MCVVWPAAEPLPQPEAIDVRAERADPRGGEEVDEVLLSEIFSPVPSDSILEGVRNRAE